MKRIIGLTLLSALLCSGFTHGKIKTLYYSLDPTSIPQHLAFYQLHSDTKEGQESLRKTWWLLTGEERAKTPPAILSRLAPAVNSLVALVSKQPYQDSPLLTDEELVLIEQAGKRLANRRLKGHAARSEEEVIALPTEEVDLARGLFLSELGSGPDTVQKRRTYEAMIDLMALQVLSRLKQGASDVEKIDAVNRFIFEEMGFRFPPHSLYAEDIDLYTFLPAVLDSRRGVCLGVSILYLCIAQRINLDLEIITPPGHIYVRYHSGDTIINIETTARGIHVEPEAYLGVETRAPQFRTMKEVIGLAHMNNAARFWHQKEYAKIVENYEKGLPYLQGDPLLQELMGFSLVLSGQKERGDALLKQVAGHMQEHQVSPDTLAADYVSGAVGAEGIQRIFMHVDEKQDSILEKQQALQEAVTRYPGFRDGTFALATTWLQLHRTKEALGVLERYHQLDATNPSVEYYLAILYAMRTDYNNAWIHFKQAKALVEARNHFPKALKELERELHLRAPLNLRLSSIH